MSDEATNTQNGTDRYEKATDDLRVVTKYIEHQQAISMPGGLWGEYTARVVNVSTPVVVGIQRRYIVQDGPEYSAITAPPEVYERPRTNHPTKRLIFFHTKDEWRDLPAVNE